jgi:putative sterol carrier protein
MSLDKITQAITDKMSKAAGLQTKVKFDFGDDGLIYVDTTQTPPVVGHEDKGDADVVLSCDIDTFSGFLDGSQDPNIAYMMGKLKVQGSMGLALQLNAILED